MKTNINCPVCRWSGTADMLLHGKYCHGCKNDLRGVAGIEIVPALVRPEFVLRMSGELKSNAHKGDWNTWRPTPMQVLSELQHHEAKLMTALSEGDCERVAEYCADLANIAMKIDEQFGGPIRNLTQNHNHES